EEAVVALEHAMDEPKLRGAIDMLVARSDPPGAWLTDVGVPAARVSVRGHKRVVAMPARNLLVVLPEALAKEAGKFSGSGGLPDPQGPEAAVATAAMPAQTLKAPRVPTLPDTLREARATLRLSDDGGADIDVEAESTTPEQAS